MLALERGEREILPADLERALRLDLALGDALAKPHRLLLELGLGGRHLDEAAPNLDEQLLLLLVAVLERLARILDSIERRARLALAEQQDARRQAHHRTSRSSAHSSAALGPESSTAAR